MTIHDLLDKEFGRDWFTFEEDGSLETQEKEFLTMDGEEIKKYETINIEKELEEVKELLMDTKLQMEGLEEMLDIIDSQMKDFDKKMIEFEKYILPRLAGFNLPWE